MSDENENAAKKSEKDKPETAEMVTLLGCEEIEVSHIAADALDEPTLKRLEKFQSLFGTTERVKVRQVRVSQMSRYGNAILSNDEATAIEIYTGKESGWPDTLTTESVNAIADKGLDINLPFFSAWYRRQAKLREAQTPQAIMDLQTKLVELERTIKESLSRASSAPSPITTG